MTEKIFSDLNSGSGQEFSGKPSMPPSDGRRFLPRHWKVRPGTWDSLIFFEIVVGNEYDLPSTFDPSDVVVDIGAHTGSFAWACLVRGAGLVHCYEVDQDNFALLKQNLLPFNAAVNARNAAVWPSETESSLVYVPPLHKPNTGAGRVTTHERGLPVTDVVAFDAVLEGAVLMSSHDSIRIVKIDVEGAEWSLLCTSKLLESAEEVVGEYHESPAGSGSGGTLQPTVDVLIDHLKTRGYSVAFRPSPPDAGRERGVFRASRR